MPGHATRDRVDTKVDLTAILFQQLGEFFHHMLCLRYRHAIARDDDDAIGFIQSRRNPICVNRHLLAFHRHLRTSCSAKAAKDHADKRAVHRFAHDVRQNRTRRANQSTNHNQQIIAEAKANRCGGPARVGVEHGNHHWHIRPTDSHDQMIANEQGHKGQNHHRHQCARVEIPDQRAQ